MAATELNFGPEWLRALTDGVGNKTQSNNQSSANNSSNSSISGNVKSNANKMVHHSSKSFSSSSTASSNCSLSTSKHDQSNTIKYRYSKEEMLSYFNRSLNVPPPKDLMQHEEVFVEDVQNPLAFIELSQDEINLLSQSINSEFALKKTTPGEQPQGSEGVGGGSGGAGSTGNSTSNTPSKSDIIISRMKMLTSGANNNSDMHRTTANGSSTNEQMRSSSISKLGNMNGGGFMSSGGNGLPERSTGYGLRGTGRGASIASSVGGDRSTPTRSALRNTNNIVFTRLSSMDNDVGGSSGAGGPQNKSSNSSGNVFITKKVGNSGASGLQRSDSTSGGSPTTGSSTWRSGSIGSAGDSLNNGKETPSTPPSSWKSLTSSNVGTTKSSWRNADTNAKNNSSNNSYVIDHDLIQRVINNIDQKNGVNENASSKSKIRNNKDFFADSNELIGSLDNELIRRIIHPSTSSSPIEKSTFSSANNAKHKSMLNRRFNNNNADPNDLFTSSSSGNSKTSSDHGQHRNTDSYHHHHHHHNQHSFNGQLDAERDLFGGRSGNNSTSTNNASSKSSFGSSLSSSNRYGSNRENRDSSSGYSANDSSMKFKSYGYQRSSSSHHFDRFNNRHGSMMNSNNNDDSGMDFFMDRFNSGGGRMAGGGNMSTSEDDDYRRNSLPEWSLEDPSSIDVTRVGTFDASGAFHEALDDDDDNADGSEFFKNDNVDEDEQQKPNDDKTTTTDKQENSAKSNQRQLNTETTAAKSEKAEPNSATSELRLSTTTSSSTITTTTTKTMIGTNTTTMAHIDYFNDPSLSPNYSSRVQQQTQQHSSNNTSSASVATSAKGSNDADSSNTTGDHIHHQIDDSMNNMFGAGVTNQQQSQQSFVSNEGKNAVSEGQHTHLSSTSDFSNQTAVVDNLSANHHLSGAFGSLMAKGQTPNESQPTPSSMLSSEQVASFNSSNSKPTTSTNNAGYNSLLDGIVNQSILTNDQVTKLSSLLDDFNFDFAGSSSAAASSTTTTTSTHLPGNKLNAVEDLYQFNRFGQRSQSPTQPEPSTTSSFSGTTSSNVHLFNNNATNSSSNDPNAQSSSSFAGGTLFSSLMSNVQCPTSVPATGPVGANLHKSSKSDLESIVGGVSAQSHHQSSMSQAAAPGNNNHANTTKWFYCDPQGQTQGPFSSQEMYEWYMAEFFPPDLLVKRSTDANFTKLKELVQVLGGQWPFVTATPPVPPSISQQPSTQHHPHHQPSSNFSPIRNHHPDHAGNAVLFSGYANAAKPQPQQPPSSTTGPMQIHHSVDTNLPPTAAASRHQIASSGYLPTTSQANSIQSVVGAGHHPSGVPFGLDDSMLNSFPFFQNLNNKQQSTTAQPPTEAQLGAIGPMGRPPPTVEHVDNVPDTNLIELLQQQQRSGPPVSGPVQENQMQSRMFMNQQQQAHPHLLQQQPPHPQVPPKDDILVQQQHSREQFFLEKFQQLSMNQFNKDQLRQLHQLAAATGNEALHMFTNAIIQQQQHQQQDDEQQQQQTIPKKLSLDESGLSAQQQQQQPGQTLQRAQSYEPPATTNMNNASNISQTHFMTAHQQQHQPHQAHPQVFHQHPASASAVSEHQKHMVSDDALQLFKKATENFVAGALSVTDVEELQRREAEERYRKQQQAQQLVDDGPGYIDQTVDEQQFIEVDRNKHKNAKQQLKQAQQQQQQKKNFQAKDSIVMSKSPAAVQQQMPNNQIPSTTPTPPQQQQPTINIPQMPQLPKKAVWGNQNSSDPIVQQQQQQLSIAEIQRLQEQKEEEERRQRELQQQMNAQMLQQQQQQNRAMKWASQPWQEQNTSQIKTLAEIQAEEAEKQAKMMRQQQEGLEAQNRMNRQRQNAPLSVIVAKGSTNGQAAWNRSGGSAWDEQDDTATGGGAGINYKNAVQTSNASGQQQQAPLRPSGRIDPNSLRQYLKTIPKVSKKFEQDIQLSKAVIETPEDLLKCSVDFLNKHFDSIDAQGFMLLVKDCGSPNEVLEYCQSYLGNNSVSLSFSKFFIAKKSHLLKLKQQEQQERNKQKLQTNKNASWNSDNDNDDHRVINYKSALNSNNSYHKTTTASTTNNVIKNQAPNTSTSQIKPATLKTTLQHKTGKLNEDVNLMTIQVESMDEFDKWCVQILKQNFELNIDVDTFISFLKDIASPDEINDYVQTYLGNTKTSRDFAKNFISKRSYLRNKAKQNEPYEDMCGPAPALTPMANSNDNNGFVTVSSSNKKKRTKNKNQNNQNNQQQQHD